jgi:hypothetical protein
MMSQHDDITTNTENSDFTQGDLALIDAIWDRIGSEKE